MLPTNSLSSINSFDNRKKTNYSYSSKNVVSSFNHFKRLEPDFDAPIKGATKFIRLSKRLKEQGWSLEKLSKFVRQLSHMGFSFECTQAEDLNLSTEQYSKELIQIAKVLQNKLIESEYPNGLDTSPRIVLTASGDVIQVNPPNEAIPLIAENLNGEYNSKKGRVNEKTFEKCLYIGDNVPFGHKK